MTEKGKKEELERKIDEINEKVDEIWNESFNRADGFEWYRSHPFLKELTELEREYRLIQDYTLYDLDGIGDHMPMDKFIACCKCGGFIDYDGYGVYATADKQTDIHVLPSDIMNNNYRKDFNYVMWYNR